MLPKKYRRDHPPMLNQAASQRKAAPMKRLSLLALSLFCGYTVSAAETHHEASMRAMVKTYCLDCHDSSVTKGDLNIDAFDGYLALYHDQGLIPTKLLAFDQAVNTTLGLPFLRTSPDHGTAFDIAGRGIADPSSLETAFDYALQLQATPRGKEHA